MVTGWFEYSKVILFGAANPLLRDSLLHRWSFNRAVFQSKGRGEVGTFYPRAKAPGLFLFIAQHLLLLPATVSNDCLLLY